MAPFSVQCKCGEARAGSLATARGVVETPALLLCTRQGAPANLTTGNLDLIRPEETRALQINPAHFVDGPPPEVVAGHPERLHGLMGLQSYVLLACLRDPFDAYVKAANDQGVYVGSHCGMRKLKPLQYMEIIQALQPDAYVALADEFYTDKPKRTKTAVDRTTGWLKEVAARHKAGNVQSLLFASVQGGISPEQRARAATAAAAVPEVDGFSVGGLGMGETQLERRAALEAAIGALPADKPRHASGLGMIEEILDGVEAGVDLIHSAYAHIATEDACALIFPLTPPAPLPAAGGSGAGAAGAGAGAEDEGGDGSKLNMRHPCHKRTVAPIVAGCLCYSCTQHTRAYIYHLVDAHEMLAEVLLEIHNAHHMLLFFNAMRAAIKQGAFGEFAAFHRSRSRGQNIGQLLAVS